MAKKEGHCLPNSKNDGRNKGECSNEAFKSEKCIRNKLNNDDK